MGMPDGLGFFTQSSDMIRDPDETAKRLLAGGATHAYVLTSSVDGRFQPVERVSKVVGALLAHNVTPALYFFPVDADLVAHERHLDECVKATGVIDVLADLEPFGQSAEELRRSQPPEDADHDWGAQEIAALVTRLRSKGYRVTISVFPRKKWKGYDWREILGPDGHHDVEVLLQLYTSLGGDSVKLERELSFWRDQGLRVIICAGSYLGDAARFRRDLHIAEEHSDVARLCVWALGSCDKSELAVALQFVVEAWPAP